jgi:protein-export membrane protein SecD
MFKSLRGRIVVILAVVGFCGWYLYQNQVQTGSLLKLGLDLQGGIHLALEVDDPDGTMNLDARADAIDRSEIVIRMRVDELGVSEPLIQKVGRDRLIVELAGITDEERAKEIIGQTALLEWTLVRPASEAIAALPRIDQVIVATLGVDSLQAIGRAVESASARDESVADLLFGREGQEPAPPTADLVPDSLLDPDADPDAEPGTQPELAADPDPSDELDVDAAFPVTESERALTPFSSLLQGGLEDGEMLVPTESYETARAFLEMPEVQAVIPRAISLQWGWEPVALGGATYRRLFVLERDAFMTGDMLEDAQAQRDPQFNQPIVSFELSRAGGRRFSDVTGRNINERIAIVLDREVVSAPVVRGRIGARGQIELGAASMEEARDLALVLRAGALPAPLRVMEERSVGPSLGQDSIDQGMVAGIVGLLLVVLVMIGYYRITGALAVAALSVYVLLVMGGLAALNATLTVPGIAGLILSIGMAVDANVLIFERIREELDQGRAVRTAVDEGFGHALSAIVDANITTLITALILFQFGTGPVRGFAVTLSIGIIASFFTALYVTRTFFLIYLKGRKATETISI